ASVLGLLRPRPEVDDGDDHSPGDEEQADQRGDDQAGSPVVIEDGVEQRLHGYAPAAPLSPPMVCNLVLTTSSSPVLVSCDTDSRWRNVSSSMHITVVLALARTVAVCLPPGTSRPISPKY